MNRIATFACLAGLLAATQAPAQDAPRRVDGGRTIDTITPMTLDLSSPVYLKPGAAVCPDDGAGFGKGCDTVRARTPVEIVKLGSRALDPRIQVRSLAAESTLAGWVKQADLEN